MALCALVVVAGLAAVDSKRPAHVPEELVEVAPPEVFVQRATSEPLEAPVRLTGEIRARRSAQIRAEASGRILEMPWRLGDRLDAGQVLALLDGSKNELAVRESTARVVQSEIALEQAIKKRDRSQLLFDSEKLSVERYEDALFAYRRAESELELRRAELASLERIANDYVIRAPYDAYITEIAVQEGDFSTAGTHAFSLVEALGTKVSFQVPAEHVSAFQRGSVHRIEIPSIGRSFDAKLAAIAKEADARSRTFELELDLEPQADVHPGMIARLSARLATGGEALFVPSSAVIEKFGGSFVFLYEDGVAREIPVTIQQRDAERVAISGDMADGAWVIAAGQHRLESGARVVAAAGELAAKTLDY
jgi:RND family efflux transporter MFP subunit